MKGKSKTGKSKSKAVRRRYNKKRNTTVNVANYSLNPIPARFITKMKYAQAFTMPGSTGLQTWQFRLNSIYDPDAISSGGANGAHKPYGFQQLFGTAQGNGLYNRYRVIGCSYVLTIHNDNYKINFGALPSNNTVSVITTMSELRENPRAKFATQNITGTMNKITGYVSCPSVVGKTKSQYMSDDRYQATWNANPDEAISLYVYCQGLNDDSGVVMQNTVNITLEYTVECFDPNNVDQTPAS